MLINARPPLVPDLLADSGDDDDCDGRMWSLAVNGQADRIAVAFCQKANALIRKMATPGIVGARHYALAEDRSVVARPVGWSGAEGRAGSVAGKKTRAPVSPPVLVARSSWVGTTCMQYFSDEKGASSK
jgi:hypothetical protein